MTDGHGDSLLAGDRPVLVVHARLDEAAFPDFRRWYRAVHLPHVLAIPGVTSTHARIKPSGGRWDSPINWLTIFEFAADTDIQAALQSSQAQRARDDWTIWSEKQVGDLSIEVYAPLAAHIMFHHWN